ncbi:MAG: hypothetical protein EON88_10730 [Brevundimonas sp.]|nr:MAG: hypothetical protein EON88_10730 [Brevundimonas sp.]
MPMPDFICPGMQKGGTSWLYDQLSVHPDFHLAPYKELHFFNKPAPQVALTRMHKAYLARPEGEPGHPFFEAVSRAEGRWGDMALYPHFFEGAEGRLAGDITPGYSTLSAEKVQALADACPAARVILMVREPSARVLSQFHMGVRVRRFSPDDISTPERLDAFLRLPRVADRAFPTAIFARWSAAFAQCRAYLMDDLIADPVAFRASVITYLGGDPTIEVGPGADFNAKQNDAKVELADWQRKQVFDYFAEERVRCAEMFGGAAEAWPSREFQ